MRICRFCGAEIKEGSRCPVCGLENSGEARRDDSLFRRPEFQPQPSEEELPKDIEEEEGESVFSRALQWQPEEPEPQPSQPASEPQTEGAQPESGQAEFQAFFPEEADPPRTPPRHWARMAAIAASVLVVAAAAFFLWPRPQPQAEMPAIFSAGESYQVFFPGKQEEALELGTGLSEYDYSQDGQQYAWIADNQLFYQPSPTAEPVFLAERAVDCMMRPEGDVVYYLSYDTEAEPASQTLYRYDASTGETESLLSGLYGVWVRQFKEEAPYCFLIESSSIFRLDLETGEVLPVVQNIASGTAYIVTSDDQGLYYTDVDQERKISRLRYWTPEDGSQNIAENMDIIVNADNGNAYYTISESSGEPGLYWLEHGESTLVDASVPQNIVGFLQDGEYSAERADGLLYVKDDDPEGNLYMALGGKSYELPMTLETYQGVFLRDNRLYYLMDGTVWFMELTEEGLSEPVEKETAPETASNLVMVDRWGNSLFSWDSMVARSLTYGGQTVTQALYEASSPAIQQAEDGSLYFLDGMGSPSLVRLQNGQAQTVAENVLDFRVDGDWVIYIQEPLPSQEDISTTAVMAYDGRHTPVVIAETDSQVSFYF